MKQELMQARTNLAMARQGYDLLDKKRQLLHRELSAAQRNANVLQIAAAQAKQLAQEALWLTYAEMNCEKSLVDRILHAPRTADGKLPYDLYRTTAAFDEAYTRHQQARTLELEYEAAQAHVHQLTQRLNKTTRRAAALQHRQIPLWEARLRHLQAQLEEHARDELARVKQAAGYCTGGGLR